jgi:hypothetical protein
LPDLARCPGDWRDDQVELWLVCSGRLSVPARGDRGRGSLVSALRPVLPRRGESRDVEELLAERGIVVDHVTIYRWVQRFTVEFIDAARPTRHCAGDRWFVDETYVKVAGGWTYLYRAVDQHGQVIDVLVSTRRNAAAAQAFFARALRYGPAPGRSRPRDGAADRHVHRHPGCDHRSSSFQEDSKRILSGSWCTSVGRFRREPDPGMCAGV